MTIRSLYGPGAMLLCALVSMGSGCRSGTNPASSDRTVAWLGNASDLEPAAHYDALEWRTNAPTWVHFEVGRLSFVTARGPRYVQRRILRAAHKAGADAVVLRRLERTALAAAEGGGREAWTEREPAPLNGHLHAAFSHTALETPPGADASGLKRGERWLVEVQLIRRSAEESAQPMPDSE